jgi:hypothetical protein
VWLGSNTFSHAQGNDLSPPPSIDTDGVDSLETRTYSDRGPIYDARDPVYRSRSKSAVPIPYQGLQYEAHTGHPFPKRDEVITLD